MALLRGKPLRQRSDKAIARDKDCSVDGCGKPHRAGGYCSTHYAQVRRFGEVRPLRTRPAVDRFWALVTKSDSHPCWLWTGHKGHGGYGTFWVGGEKRWKYAHRFAYELVLGPIPEGLFLDHLCRNRACVNPAHLEPVETRENLLRGEGFAAKNTAKTHCPREHEFTPENTYQAPGRLHRQCRTCERDRRRVRSSATV